MNNKQKSIIAMLISAFGFSLMGVFVKFTGDIPVIQKVMFRVLTIAIVSFIATRLYRIRIREIKHHKLLLLRSLFGTCGILINFYAIDTLILSDANVIFRLSTVFVVILSWIFLNERITKKQLFTILVAFIGIIFIMKPSFSIRLIPYLIALLGSFVAGISYTTLRPLGKSEHPIAVVFYFSTFASIVITPYVLLNFVPMTKTQWLYAILAGMSAVVGQIGITFAYRLAPAKEVSIYGYFGVVFSAIFSMFIFDIAPDILSVIGYIIIFASAYYNYRIS